MRLLLHKIWLLSAFTCLVSGGCLREKEKTGETPFDRPAMLRDLADQLINPGYAQLKQDIDTLRQRTAAFTAQPTTSTLVTLQAAFQQAYLSYQDVSMFEFGPAESELLRASFNTFPCDTAEINTKVTAGNYNLSTVADLDAKGFPAIDFLLFGKQHENDYILYTFTAGPQAANRKTYLTAVVSELLAKITNVASAWGTGGTYTQAFVSNTGADVGSSLGYLVNQLNFDFELLKNYKIGIPLGKKTMGTILPEKVEGYYGRQSLQLCIRHMKAIENLYLGRSLQGTDKQGFDEYLRHLKAEYNGGLLADAIKAQLTTANSKLQAIPDLLPEAIVNNPALVDAAYIELQKLVVLFKTDMPSALGVLITYQDNDGD